jgi:hypothetical protein
VTTIEGLHATADLTILLGCVAITRGEESSVRLNWQEEGHAANEETNIHVAPVGTWR